MPLLDAPDGRLWVEVTGEGPPVTVFAHGLTSSSADIAFLASATPGTRVLFDFRGHGRSETAPGASFDLDAMTADLAFVCERFDAAQAAGVSMGAAALLRVLAGGARLSRVLLVIPALVEAMDAGVAAAHLELADRLERASLDDVASVMLSTPEVRSLVARAPVWAERIRGQVSRMNATGLPAALRAIALGPPALEDLSVLGGVSARALILAHEGDASHDAGVARRLAEAIPDAEVRVWPEPLAMMDSLTACAAQAGAFFDDRARVAS